MSTTKKDEGMTGAITAIRIAKSLPEAPDGMKYFAVGEHAWGRGSTAVTAIKNCRENASPRTRYALHLVNADAEVDQVDGTLHYRKADANRVSILRARFTA